MPRLAEIEAVLAARQVTNTRLSTLLDGEGDQARVIVVDSVGVLAEIYRAGHLAYIGGSFTTGVHNTMEPAIARMPVLFGPRIQNAEEAGVLVEREAGFVCRQPDQALSAASRLLENPTLLEQTGDIARQVVLDQRGATAKSLAVLGPALGV